MGYIGSLVRVFDKIIYKTRPIEYAKKVGVNVGENVRFTGIPRFGTEPWLITIGDNCVFSSEIIFITHDGSVNTLRRLDEKYKNIIKFGKIEIGDNVFIGQGVTIMPNVKIGNNAVVGLGSVVTKDVPEGVVVAGVPAKVICSARDLAEKLYKTTPEYDSSKDFRALSTEIAEHYWSLRR